MSLALVTRPAPEFDLPTVSADRAEIVRASLADYAGGWLLLAFYPRDFSFVCPTELVALSARLEEFAARDCRVLAASVDACETHREWLAAPPAQGGAGPLRFPLASDFDGRVAARYGVWSDELGLALRGLFLIDPAGTLQYAVVHNLAVGRNVDEILRVLDALQAGGLCPASWTRADGTIDVERALRPGRVLGGYRLQRLLGQGAFGHVFAARDLRLERVVALKVLRRLAAGAEQAVLREARAAAALDHPNVGRVLTVETIDGLPTIVMEHLDGPPLDRVALAALDDDARRTIARGVAAGLAAAHARGVIHGDLKPANILVTAGPVPRIVDFGLARIAADEPTAASPTASLAAAPSAVSGSLDATASHGELGPAGAAPPRAGTPAYMAPELWAGSAGTTAADVYALGLVLAELFTGCRAPGGESLASLLGRSRDPTFAAQLVADLPAPLARLLADMLALDPDARPAAADVAERLA